MPSPDPPAKRPRRAVRLGKYEVLAHIASGGMGAVYKAVDTVLKREVALKVLPTGGQLKPNALERFRREARNAARLRHENIVTVYEFDRAGDTWFLAMELVEGIDLQEYVSRKGRLDPEEARLITVQAARALDHAHAEGVVHRDVKPSNFLVTRKGETLVIKLSDFGLARETSDEEARVTRDGHTVGTVDYMSPEQARNSGAADCRSDIYSLGCTLFHMLAGRPPFPDGSIPERLYKHARDEPPDLRQLNPRVSEAMCAVLRRMLAKDPAERYATPADLLQDLIHLDSTAAPLAERDVLAGLAFAADEEPSAEPERPPARAPRRPRPAAPLAPRGPRRDKEPAAAEKPRPADAAATGVRAHMPLIVGTAAAALVMVVVLVLVLRRPSHTDERIADGNPPPSVLPPTGDSGRGPNPITRPPDTAKGPPAPAKVEWPALYRPSAPPAKDKLQEEVLAPWAGLTEPGPDVPVLHVTRRPAGEGAFASLGAACAAAAAGRLTVIEIDDNGPLFQPSVAVADRNLVIRPGKAYRPLLVWDTDAEARGAAFLAVTRGNLTLDRLDVVGKWTEAGAAERPVLVRVTDGDLLARDCTFSLAGQHPAGLGAVRFERSEAGGVPRPGSARCRLSRCVARGPGLVALDLAAPGADVLLDDCLLVGTDQPLLRVAGRARSSGVLRLLRSTLAAGQTVLQVRPATPADTRPDLVVRAWDALLARGGGPSGGQMVVLAGGHASQMRWDAVNSLYAGWRTLLATADGTTDDVDHWQVGWQRTEGDKAVAAGWPAAASHEPAEVDVKEYQPAPSPTSPVGFAAITGPGPLGCDPAALPPARTNWLALTYGPHPAPELEAINDATAPPVTAATDGRYHGGRIDLTQTKDLGLFLETMQRSRGLGPRVVLHLAGGGEHATQAIRVKGSSLVLYFEPVADGVPPPVLVPHERVPPDGEALIEVDGGGLDVIGGEVRFPDFRLALMPPYALKVRGGDLRLFGCRLSGPLLHPPDNYRGLIRFEGASGEPGPAKPRGCALNETVLVSARSVLHVPGGGARLLVRQCVLLAAEDGLYFEPGPTAKARLDVQCFLENTTVAARRAALRLGDAPQLEGPVEPIVLEARFSAFLNPLTDAPSPPSPLAVDGAALSRGLLVWRGVGNAFDKRLGRDVLPKLAGAPGWARLWGRAWERRQALDVPLTRTLDLAKPELERLAVPASLVKPVPGEDRPPTPGADFERLGLLKKPAKPPR
jgi:serine/threonine-protein kinase